jgi:hypothetical protein
LDVSFELGDVLVFGKESVGLPKDLLLAREQEVIGIPMSGLVRSHNLANSVAIVLYEALRQTGALTLHSSQPARGRWSLTHEERGHGCAEVRVNAARRAGTELDACRHGCVERRGTKRDRVAPRW